MEARKENQEQLSRSALARVQGNPLNGSPDNGSIHLLLQFFANPIL